VADRLGQTVIVRMGGQESDLLADFRHAAPNARARREVVSREQEVFFDTTRRFQEFLNQRRLDTSGLLSDVLAREPFGHADNHDEAATEQFRIPSSAGPGVLAYQPLAASRAYAVTATDDVIESLRGLPEVAGVHPNYRYTLLGQGLGVGPGTWHLRRMGAADAWQRSTGSGARVAVLDTGVDFTLPELAHVQQGGFAEFDRLGRQVPNSRPHDTHAHGSFVTGLLCGATVGIAPGVMLLSGLIAPNGFTTFAQLASGIEWAAAQGADIVSMSVGKSGYTRELEASIGFAARTNVLVVAAIGNSGAGQHSTPGDYAGVLSVGATNSKDEVWGSSGGGRIQGNGTTYLKPDLYAPGVQVYSCIRGQPHGPADGTSLATPLVAGVAALVKQLAPTMPAAQLRQHLLTYSLTIQLPANLGASSGLLVSASAAIAAVP
jgi:subtilisin family serine protease